MKNNDLLTKVYNALLAAFGSQHWWPGDTPLEIAVGAILTQNTNWTNVEKAIRNLKQADMLDLARLRDVNLRTLARLIKPSGYFNIKAKRLKAFVEWVCREFEGDLEAMFERSVQSLREDLLSVKGIGPETADSILLYAGGLPVFVVDAYTYRICRRHRLILEEATYDEVAEFFTDNLPEDVAIYNEYHALLVMLGKMICKRRKPRCDVCPIRDVFEEEPELAEDER
ncbi:MAG: endonuclease III domain-containing protein [Planctomycetes bacterium]|nr:endonuclease III domain-containing protein [Planctomycetota bacterium]